MAFGLASKEPGTNHPHGLVYSNTSATKELEWESHKKDIAQHIHMKQRKRQIGEYTKL